MAEIKCYGTVYGDVEPNCIESPIIYTNICEYMKCKAKFKTDNFSLKKEGELKNSIDNDVFKEITETNLRQTVR